VRWTDWTGYPEMKQIHRSCILVADFYQTGRNTPREVGVNCASFARWLRFHCFDVVELRQC
jgi:hypothetical protein